MKLFSLLFHCRFFFVTATLDLDPNPESNRTKSLLIF